MKRNSFFPRPTRSMCIDSGLALILIGLIYLQFTGKTWIVPLLIALTVLVMVWPRSLYPFAALWFKFSELLGSVMSKVILSILFFVVVTPIGLLRRLTGADAMKRKAWRAGDDSVMTVRDHDVVGADLEQLY